MLMVILMFSKRKITGNIIIDDIINRINEMQSSHQAMFGVIITVIA